MATLVPLALLGALVLGVPDTFAVPANEWHTFTGPAGESVQVEVTPLVAGAVDVHYYLSGATNAPTTFGRIPISATSSTGRHAVGAVFILAPDHDLGTIRLSTGVWNLRVALTDSAGHVLRGSFAVPIN